MQKAAIFLIALFIGYIPYAQAETWQPLDLARRYDMFWGGVKVGYIAAEIRQNKKGIYRFELRVKSKGLLDWVTNYHSDSVTTFKLQQGKVIPITFESEGWLRKKYRRTYMEYDKNGLVTKEILFPPKKSWKHEEVPLKLLRDAQNPLTGAILSREKIIAFLDADLRENRFEIPIYDAKRLGKYTYTILGEEKMSYKGSNVNTIGMRFTRSAIAGFSDSEIKKLKEEPTISVYFIKDQSLLPFKGEAKIPYGGSAVILFNRNCESIDACAVQD